MLFGMLTTTAPVRLPVLNTMVGVLVMSELRLVMLSPVAVVGNVPTGLLAPVKVIPELWLPEH